MTARPAPTSALFHNNEYTIATTVFVMVGVGVTIFPGALLGAGLAILVWRVSRPSIVATWLLGVLGAATAAMFWSALVPGWPWHLLLAWAQGASSGLTPWAVLQSVAGEALLGPLLVASAQFGLAHAARTIQGQEWLRTREMASRKKALERGWTGPQTTNGAAAGPSRGHMRLGAVAEDQRPFDLSIEELSQHVFLPGASGSGKTTTIARIADGALANGYGVVIVDCKGSGLGGVARSLAERHKLPFTLVDPRDPDTAGYDPCSGDAAAIANKLIGAFSFSGEAEIYKHIAMEVVPVICRAMAASNTHISLDSIYGALNRGALSRLGRRDGAEPFRERLEQLEESGGIGAAGYIGLQRRLGALIEGSFGEVFRRMPALSWAKQLATPHVTYLSLSATAASEDVELFGRVITQDLKQVCDERMRAIDRGENPTPVLIVYDEFAALREAVQVVDLLLQARQARAPLVVATQYLPEEIPIRRPVLSAGLLIVHRLEAEDAELMASQFGTHTTPMLTAQVDYETGGSEKGSVRYVEEFDMHPNVLKDLPVGMAAVLSRRSGRKALVRVERID